MVRADEPNGIAVPPPSPPPSITTKTLPGAPRKGMKIVPITPLAPVAKKTVIPSSTVPTKGSPVPSLPVTSKKTVVTGPADPGTTGLGSQVRLSAEDAESFGSFGSEGLFGGGSASQAGNGVGALSVVPGVAWIGIALLGVYFLTKS